ncbi:MAG: indolepyruvate ferredoxin oxidoreductase subunit alpha [Tissierellales bacterium]|nr:indolepyruvate ferredoxin oxidoreductase subunit alpha [Tissierellales bacterium]MBN2827743.1 indolepyruvate ferredoxin oxidoreductase subunit alpha [Tissierellales bacterium]
MKVLMTGNEAVARGAYEAGVLVASAYPGTPSTEIMENFSQYEGVYAEWAPNEKVAAEVAMGAAVRGVRAFAAMKHVGLNVAADPFMSFAYHGTNGGLVIITADEPNMFSSQNEQDNRLYSTHAKVICIEPSDSQECIDYMKIAFEISEKFDTMVLFRMTTRVCHSKTPVTLGERIVPPTKSFEKNARKYIMVPAHSKARHPEIESNMEVLREYSNKSPLNREEMHDTEIGIICNGMSYQYAQEVMGDKASYLKIGLSNPLPDQMIKDFSKKVKKLYVIEENEPFMEMQIKSWGIECIGKEIFPICGEFSPELIREVLLGIKPDVSYVAENTPPSRPPVLCAGCPHRGIFFELGKYRKKAFFSGDIGCYSLGYLPPFEALDLTIDMGASISAAQGFQRANELSDEANETLKPFALIGDSTFFHSGVTGLLNMTYNHTPVTTIIMDNSITAMTGHQNNPGTGVSAMGNISQKIDIELLVEACGVKKHNIVVVDPYDLKATRTAVKAGYEATEPFVIITRRECALLKPIQKEREKMKCKIDPEKCKFCKSCIRTGCPALQIDHENNKVFIDTVQCNGCTVCLQVCPYDAIERIGE